MKNFILGIFVTLIICSSCSCWNSYRLTDCYMDFWNVVELIEEIKENE